MKRLMKVVELYGKFPYNEIHFRIGRYELWLAKLKYMKGHWVVLFGKPKGKNLDLKEIARI